MLTREGRLFKSVIFKAVQVFLFIPKSIAGEVLAEISGSL